MTTVDLALRANEPLTQAAFRRWLRRRPLTDINHYELIQGRIVMTPPAGWPHGSIGSALNCHLRNHVDAENLGVVLDASTGYELPSGDTLEPDVSFIAAARFAAGPAPERGKFLRIVPNLVVEILSRGTRRRDLTDKRRIYAANGVEEYWVVDPDARTLTLFGSAAGEGRVVRRGRVRSAVLPGLALTPSDLFRG